MKTVAGVPLTEKEIKLIRELEKLAKKWEKDGGRLWLFSASGTLTVMLEGDLQSNPIPKFLGHDGVNQDNEVCKINGIPNDGGDW